jgi:hypothetical protein
MVRRLTSPPALVALLVVLLFIVFGIGFDRRTNMVAFVGGTMVVVAALTGLGLVRYRRVSAWMRHTVPSDFSNAPSALATIVSGRPTREWYNNEPVMRYEVTVHAPDGDFSSSLEALLPRHYSGRFRIGSRYPVRYLPADHSIVFCDPDETAGSSPTAASLPTASRRRKRAAAKKAPAAPARPSPQAQEPQVATQSEPPAVAAVAVAQSEPAGMPEVVTDPDQPLDAPSFISPAPLPGAAPASADPQWPPPGYSAEGGS